MNFSKECFGTKLNIKIIDQKYSKQDIKNCFSEVTDFEKKYSRFIENNFLYNLNKNKKALLDKELLSIIKLCNKVSNLTNGYFDITILPVLENIGYGILKEQISENLGYKNIELTKSEIILNNGVSVDLGSIGKGYIVDKVYNLLDNKYQSFTINFGGDIRVKGKHKILLEDPMDDKKIIGEIVLINSSIASSNSRKRKTTKGHHLINAKNKKSINDKKTIFITHKLSTFSDIFSTALFVSPINLSFKIIDTIPGLEALIITETGEIYKSSGFNSKLY